MVTELEPSINRIQKNPLETRGNISKMWLWINVNKNLLTREQSNIILDFSTVMRTSTKMSLSLLCWTLTNYIYYPTGMTKHDFWSMTSFVFKNGKILGKNRPTVNPQILVWWKHPKAWTGQNFPQTFVSTTLQ